MIDSKQRDKLLQSVGSSLISEKGKILGKVIEITEDKRNGNMEYVILQSELFFGRGERFFAVPASSAFIDIAEKGQLVLKLHKDDLQFAKGVSADKCPKPNLKFGKSVYELYQYQVPDDKKIPSKTMTAA